MNDFEAGKGRNPEIEALDLAARYGRDYRTRARSLHPVASAEELRQGLCLPLPEHPQNPEQVIAELIAAAEPGLVGNTAPRFHGWVMGGSDLTGVAADWLTSVWGQNSGIYQTAPSAAIVEEAVSAWLLELLDLPRESSVGLVTGATMAGFACLAAARWKVLTQIGVDIEEVGVQGAPPITAFLSDDTHISNIKALRYLGLGRRNIVQVRSDDLGVMDIAHLRAEVARVSGPKIILSQAGHINSGAFDDFRAIRALADETGAWHHVDGAFGLWARVLRDKDALTRDLDQADSWSVDGHKWLQLPYDSGFAIVKDAQAHRAAMGISASYLNRDSADGRNPTDYNPELSRRARGFAAWAVLKSLGRSGVTEMIGRHCDVADALADRLARIEGIRILNPVALNQIVLTCIDPATGKPSSERVHRLAEAINRDGKFFVRTATWKDQEVLRISVISRDCDRAVGEELASTIASLSRALNETDWRG